MQPYPEEHLVERLVTYTLEMDGRLYVIKHVPTRVNVETGEQFFAPETVERIQQIIRVVSHQLHLSQPQTR